MKIRAEAYSALPCHCWLQWFLNFLIVKWRFTSCTPPKVVSIRKHPNQENQICDGSTIHWIWGNKIVIGVMGMNHPQASKLEHSSSKTWFSWKNSNFHGCIVLWKLRVSKALNLKLRVSKALNLNLQVQFSLRTFSS